MENNTFQQCFEFYNRGREKNGQTWNDLASDFGYVNGEALRSAFRRELKDRGLRRAAPAENLSPAVIEGNFSREFRSDGTVVSEMVTRALLAQMKDPNYVLRLHGFNPEEWEVVSYKSNVWSGYAKQDESDDKIMYQSKISVRPVKPQLTKEFIESIYKNLEPRSTDEESVPRDNTEKHKLLVATVSDLHFGRLAEREVSGEDYDLGIAALRMMRIVRDYRERYEGRKDIEKVVFFFLSDFFNVDNVQMATSKGTSQINCAHPQTMFKEGCNLAISCINELSKIAPVIVPYVESNHDSLTAYHLALFLRAWYKDDNRVTVDASPLARKYIQYGNTLLGFSHGHNDSKTIPYVMAAEAAKEWGETKYHEFLCGHLHHEMTVPDKTGTILRRLSAPVVPDQWSYQKGFTVSQKKSQALLYDRENGLEEIFYT